MTRDEIIAAIADITARMRGPMSNLERAWDNEDRKELRAELAKLDAESTPSIQHQAEAGEGES